MALAIVDGKAPQNGTAVPGLTLERQHSRRLTAPEAVDRLAHDLDRPLGERPVGPCLVRGAQLTPSMRTIGTEVNDGRLRRWPGQRQRLGTGECQPGCCTLLLHRLPRDPLLRRSFQAGGQPGRAQVGSRPDCPWVTAGDRSFPPVLARTCHGCSASATRLIYNRVPAIVACYHQFTRCSHGFLRVY